MADSAWNVSYTNGSILNFFRILSIFLSPHNTFNKTEPLVASQVQCYLISVLIDYPKQLLTKPHKTNNLIMIIILYIDRLLRRHISRWKVLLGLMILFNDSGRRWSRYISIGRRMKSRCVSDERHWWHNHGGMDLWLMRMRRWYMKIGWKFFVPHVLIEYRRWPIKIWWWFIKNLGRLRHKYLTGFHPLALLRLKQ